MTRQARDFVVGIVSALAVIMLTVTTLLPDGGTRGAVPAPTPTPASAGTPNPVPTSTPALTAAQSPPAPVSVAGAAGSETRQPPPAPAPAPRPPDFDPASEPPIPAAVMNVELIPDRSIHVAARYLAHNNARRASMGELIDRGRPLPAVTASCARAWGRSGLDRRIDRSKVRFLCLDQLAGKGFKPQGVAGSGTTKDFVVGDDEAAARNLVLTSWYRGSTTRLVVIDLDRNRYNVVDLVRPAGSRKFRALRSHGSGLAWAGNYLYSSSLNELLMYNAGDILRVKGRYVLPAIARWGVRGRGGLSSISIDRTSSPARLRGINYTPSGQAVITSFDLAADGSLAPGGGSAATTLAPGFGRQRRVHSVSTQPIGGKSYQGVAAIGAYRFANSSATRVKGRRLGDMVMVVKNGRVVTRYRMPHGNGQSIYLDYRRERFVSATEAGRQFLYLVPLRELTR